MINLLPPKYKEDLLSEETKRLVIILGSLFFISLLSFSLILFSIKIYLTSQVNAQKEFLDLQTQKKETPEMGQLENEAKAINKKFSKLDNFYQKQISLSEVMEKINKAIPSGVYLNSFAYFSADSKINFVGYSPTREALVQFRKNLEEIFQQKIEVPPANWVKAANVDFTGVNFKINK
jgi:Tfp pilus assembly protein PilN